MFAPVAGHPSTVRALVGRVRRTSASRTTPRSHRLAATEPARRVRRRAATAASATLTAGTYDDEDQLEVAAALVAEHGVPADLGALVLFCPERLTPGGARARRRLRRAHVHRARCSGSPATPTPTPRRATLAARARAAPRRAARLRARRARASATGSSPRPTRRARSARSCARWSSAADAGRSLHDVAVAWRVAEPHARLLHERLGEAGIPVYGPSIRRARGHRHRPHASSRCIDLIDRDFRRDDVMAFLAGAPIRETAGGRTGAGRPLGPDLARRRASSRAPTSGATRLARRRDELVAGPATRTRSGSSRRLDDDRPARAVRRRARRRAPTETFTTWAEWCSVGRPGSSTGTSASRRRRGPRPRSTRTTTCSTGSRRSARSRAPIAGRPRDVPRRARRGARAVRRPRRPLRRRRAARARSRALRGTDFDTVFVVGAAEGRLPPPPRDDPLLPDRERAVTGGQVPAAVDRRGARARRLPRRARRRAQPRSSSAGPAPIRSASARCSRPRWVVETVRALHRHARSPPASSPTPRPARCPGCSCIESFAAALAPRRRPRSRSSELELQGARRDAPSGRRPSPAPHPLAAANPTLARGFRAAARPRASPASPSSTASSGPRPGLLPDPERPLSPSRIEAWAQCPFRYFLANLLRLRKREAPEAIDTIDPRTRGSLVHKVLEDFVQRDAGAHRRRTSRGHRRSATGPGQIADRALRRGRGRGPDRAAAAVAARAGPDPARGVAHARRRRAHPRRARPRHPRHRDQLRARARATRCRRSTLELDGAQVTFRGPASTGSTRRPDPDGPVVVYDYKTGSADGLQRPRRRPGRAGHEGPARDLRARRPSSAFPGRPVRADYWHTAQPAGKELRGFDIDDAGPRAREVLATVAGGVAAGHVPRVPGQGEPVLQLVRRVRLLRLRPPLLARPRADVRREARRPGRRASSSSSAASRTERSDRPRPRSPPTRPRATGSAPSSDARSTSSPAPAPGKTHELVERVVGAAPRRPDERDRRDHVHHRRRERAPGAHPRAGRGARGRGEPRRRPVHRRARTRSTTPRSPRSTRSRSGSSPTTRSRRRCRPASRCSTRSRSRSRSRTGGSGRSTRSSPTPTLAELAARARRARREAEPVPPARPHPHRPPRPHRGLRHRPGAGPAPRPGAGRSTRSTRRPRCAARARDPDDRLLVHLDGLDELGEPAARAAATTSSRRSRCSASARKLTCSNGQAGELAERRQGRRGRRRARSRRTPATRRIAAVIQPAILNVLCGARPRGRGRGRRGAGTTAGSRSTTSSSSPATCCATTPRSAHALADRFQVLLLDEFQDTDPLQIDLALRIAGDRERGRRGRGAGARSRPARARCSSSATRSSRSTGSGAPTSSSTAR